ncbi:MAG: hypothetical protein HY000_01510 [Planctomycetes bacterium]|nr:hypothetical protein [Planctomycetota bacterium]
MSNPNPYQSPEGMRRPIEELLILAAFHETVHGRFQSPYCSGVIRLAMEWAGTWQKEAERYMHTCTGSPEADEYYRSLIAMIQEGTLIKGLGDVARPAAPHFTQCYLTPAGHARAQSILANNPPPATQS